MTSDLKNGLPIYVNLKHNITKVASKKFYFAMERIHPTVLQSLSKFTIISTKERKTYGSPDLDIILPETEEEELLLKLLKTLEIVPILVATESLDSRFMPLQFNKAEVKDFLSNFVYDVKLVSQSPISLKNAEEAEFYFFRTLFCNIEHYAIKIGKPENDKIPLIRIHSSCYTGDLLASLRCDCRDQLQESIKFISQNKDYSGGYILYLMQEGRGIGLANKIEAYRLQQEASMDTVDSNLSLGFLEDERSFLPAKRILDFFEIDEVCLITNNPKKQEDLQKLGINVVKTLHTVYNPNPHNIEYLEVKHQRMGHKFDDGN